MKIGDFRAKTPVELRKLLEENRLALQKLRFGMIKGEVKNVQEYGRTRRDIARILTIIKEQPYGQQQKS
ncbi:MAG: 50S ribosomal protein L29 [Candidatus Portnoybacteria bacterium]|nr:50S ribosomal protein L29 [Candidatus Portnoybacteria bacterium]